MSPTSTHRRSLATVAIATGLAVAALGMSAPAQAAGQTASISPKSGPIGTAINVSGNCGTKPAGNWIQTVIGLYYSDAHTSSTDVKDAFTFRRVPTSATGSYNGAIEVGPKAFYNKQGPNPSTPGAAVERPVTGTIGVQVVCYTTESPFPASIKALPNSFTVGAKGTSNAKSFTVSKKPSIKGKKKAGKKLTAKPGSWSPAPSSISYQWKRGKKAIADATKKKYKVTTADKGKKVSVVVTGKRSGYATKKVASPKVKIKGRS